MPTSTGKTTPRTKATDLLDGDRLRGAPAQNSGSLPRASASTPGTDSKELEVLSSPHLNVAYALVCPDRRQAFAASGVLRYGGNARPGQGVRPFVRVRVSVSTTRPSVDPSDHLWVLCLGSGRDRNTPLAGVRSAKVNATISIRSYQVLSLHPPLLGQLSTLSLDTTAISCMPRDRSSIGCWHIPVHLAPSNGALWGAAVLVGLALSLSVEALWRNGDRWACGIVGLAPLGIACLLPAVLAEPSWNPNFGFCFMVASIALAWVIASGSLSWWPWLVATSSVAVQSHIFFVFFAMGLVVGAPLIGLTVRKPERWRWLTLGTAVGAVCWLPTMIQEATGNPRNLSSILKLNNGGASGISLRLEEPPCALADLRLPCR